jgi:hypothetical protein
MVAIRHRIKYSAARAQLLHQRVLRLRTRARVLLRHTQAALGPAPKVTRASVLKSPRRQFCDPILFELLPRLNVQTVLDAPCGDWNWMRLVDLSEVEYIGADILRTVIERNRSNYSHPISACTGCAVDSSRLRCVQGGGRHGSGGAPIHPPSNALDNGVVSIGFKSKNWVRACS